MKATLAILAIAFSSIAYGIEPRAIDGDTVDTGFKPFANLSAIKIRIIGVDTPEIRGKCDLEKQRAKAAKLFLAERLKSGHVEYQFIDWDKYGGRVVGEIFVDDQPMSQALIDNGHAIKYTGGKKTKDWCQ